MNNIYFKKEWFDAISELPEVNKKNTLFYIIDYIINNKINEIDNIIEKVIFEYVKKQIENVKKNTDKDYLYIIRCYCEIEKLYFIKYGTTNHKNIDNRFSFNKNSMPYEFKVLDIYKKTNTFNPVEIEKIIKKSNLKKYKPLKKFGGYSECLRNFEYKNLKKLIE